VFSGTHASGVVFGVALKTFIAFPIGNSPKRLCDESSGATPELARGTRVLPIPISEFGFNHPRLFLRFVTTL
jgi:hypothetical protein